MDNAPAVAQTQHIARAAALGQERFQRVLYDAVAKVAQKGIAGAQREKSERGTISRQSLRIQAIHDFVRSAIASHGDKVPATALIGLARDLGCISRRAGFRDLNFDAAGPHAFERGGQQLATASRSGRRIYDCKVTLPQVSDRS
jgi:hypothetical protein